MPPSFEGYGGNAARTLPIGPVPGVEWGEVGDGRAPHGLAGNGDFGMQAVGPGQEDGQHLPGRGPIAILVCGTQDPFPTWAPGAAPQPRA